MSLLSQENIWQHLANSAYMNWKGEVIGIYLAEVRASAKHAIEYRATPKLFFPLYYLNANTFRSSSYL